MFDDEQDSIGRASTDAPPDHYKSYITAILKTSTLSANEQLALQRDMAYVGPLQILVREYARERLWRDSLRLVLYVLHNMRKAGRLPAVRLNDMDAIQAGNMAVGESLHNWDPDKGTLSTYLVPRISGALLDYQTREIRAGRFVSIDDEEVSSYEIADSEVPAEQTQSLPVSETVEQVTFPNPETEAYHVQIAERVQRMPAIERDLLESYYFLDESVAVLAERYQTTEQTIYNRIGWALNTKFWKNF